jgi:signal recognition particle subunit SRP54
MGNIKDLMSMIPGVGKQVKDLEINDNAFTGIEAMINSMTLEERRNPDIINPSRKLRIAKGSGKELSELNQFLKQFDQMKQMMKMMNKMPMGRMPGLKR